MSVIEASNEPASIELTAFGESLVGALAGSKEELGRLLEQYRPYLLAIANAEFASELGGKLAPSDLVQESIVAGYEEFGGFRGTTAQELAGWLRQILLNQLANIRKSFGRDKRDVGREQAAGGAIAQPRQLSPSAEALSREERQRLDAALEKAPQQYQQVILLRHRENLSFAEIGARLDRSAEAARKLWARAVRQLQTELGIDDASERKRT